MGARARVLMDAGADGLRRQQQRVASAMAPGAAPLSFNERLGALYAGALATLLLDDAAAADAAVAKALELLRDKPGRGAGAVRAFRQLQVQVVLQRGDPAAALKLLDAPALQPAVALDAAAARPGGAGAVEPAARPTPPPVRGRRRAGAGLRRARLHGAAQQQRGLAELGVAAPARPARLEHAGAGRRSARPAPARHACAGRGARRAGRHQRRHRPPARRADRWCAAARPTTSSKPRSSTRGCASWKRCAARSPPRCAASRARSGPRLRRGAQAEWRPVPPSP